MSAGNRTTLSDSLKAVGQPVALFADLDERDLRIAADRIAAFLDRREPKVGDYVKFADGIERRISHVWPADWHDDGIATVQTSDGGSFYLGNGYCSFSGALYPGVSVETLTLTGTIRRGLCWFFHHDHHCAHNGVTIKPPMFDEWTSSQDAPR